MKTILKKLLLIVSTLIIIIVLVTFIDYKSNNIKKDYSADVEHILLNRGIDEFQLNDMNLSFDYLYVIGPYETTEMRHLIVGNRWYDYSTYMDYLINEYIFDGSSGDESLQELVFIKDQKIIGVGKLLRQYGDMIDYNNPIYTSTELLRLNKSDDSIEFYEVERVDE